MPPQFTKQLQMFSRRHLAIGVALLALAGAGFYGFTGLAPAPRGDSELSSQSRKGLQRYVPTPAEWASLTVEPVTERTFRAEHVTEGKIAIDEDRSTPVFSPYAGRVIKLLAKPGDHVTQGQPLVRDRSGRHRAGPERFHLSHDRPQQGTIGARSRAVAGHPRQGSVRRQGGPAQGLSAVPGHADPGAERSALVANRAGGRPQQAENSRPERRGHCGVPAEGTHRPQHHDLLADRGHGGAAQDRTRAIYQFRRQRSGVRDRRSLHRLAHGLCPRNRRIDRVGGAGAVV